MQELISGIGGHCSLYANLPVYVHVRVRNAEYSGSDSAGSLACPVRLLCFRIDEVILLARAMQWIKRGGQLKVRRRLERDVRQEGI